MWCKMLLRNLPRSKIPNTKREEIIQDDLPKGASRFHRLLASGES